MKIKNTADVPATEQDRILTGKEKESEPAEQSTEPAGQMTESAEQSTVFADQTAGSKKHLLKERRMQRLRQRFYLLWGVYYIYSVFLSRFYSLPFWTFRSLICLPYSEDFPWDLWPVAS